MVSVRRRLGVLSAFALLLAVLPACDSGGGPEPSGDNLFLGVNLTRLFAAPTEAEIQAVLSEWQARNAATATAASARIVTQSTTGGATLYVVSHDLPGTSGTHYGLVRIPTGASNAPVLVVHHGGDRGFGFREAADFDLNANKNPSLQAALFPDLFARTVQVMPSYRSEELRTGSVLSGGPYTSGGSASPWDYDVDDSMALLSAALQLFPDQTDDSRIAAMGFSRGAETAVLQAIRDPRIDAVTDYFGPTDFYNEAVVTQLAPGLIAGSPAATGLPGAIYLRNSVLLPLQGAGGAYNPDADYAKACLEVVRRSASLFTARLPDLQVHHHQADPVVPFPFSQAFDAAVRARPNQGAYEFNAYTNAVPAGIPPPGSPHQPEALDGAAARTQAFLGTALGLGTPTLQSRPAPALAGAW